MPRSRLLETHLLVVALLVLGAAAGVVIGAAEAAKKQSLSSLELRRGHAREKGEEREIWRAQIYALNKLMRAREEASFEYFKQLREGHSADAAAPYSSSFRRSSRVRPLTSAASSPIAA